MTNRWRGDQGSLAVELAILSPAFVLMFAFVVFIGRLQSERADVEAAAHSAARSITLSRNTPAALATAQAAAQQQLDVGSSTCRSMSWDADVTGSDVTVTISCALDTSDMSVLPLPGHIHVTGTATEVWDVFTEGRQP